MATIKTVKSGKRMSPAARLVRGVNHKATARRSSSVSLGRTDTQVSAAHRSSRKGRAGLAAPIMDALSSSVESHENHAAHHARALPSPRKRRSGVVARAASALPSSQSAQQVMDSVEPLPTSSLDGRAIQPAADDRLTPDNDVIGVVARLVFLCRVRSQIQQAKLRFGNQMAAMDRLRTGELKGKVKAKREPTADDIAVAIATQGHLAPFVAPLDAQLREQDKEIARLAMELPVWAFTEAIRGFGALGLGLIVGQTGDLSNYSNPGKLWKRMGLALVGGERQRRVTDPEKAIAHGYNPRRRSLMHVIGDSLIKQNGRSGEGYYRKVYDDRKVYTAETTHSDWTKAHRHMDALRYMEKRLLRHLWQAWKRQAVTCANTAALLPALLDADAYRTAQSCVDVPQPSAIM